MIGTIFNTSMILAGCLVGSIFKKGIKPAYHAILLQALGLAACVIGINAVVQRMPQSKYPVLFIVSLAIGGLIGQALDIQGHFDRWVGRLAGGNLAEGLATAVLLYCIGSLSILGPIEAALKHDYTFLFTNGMFRWHHVDRISIHFRIWHRDCGGRLVLLAGEPVCFSINFERCIECSVTE